MTKIITNPGQWKPGQSGNPNGRKPKGRALTELLRLKGEEVISIGSEPVTAQEALAKAVWQFVTTGEVWLRGKKLEAQHVGEWASVVKWLYMHVEPTSRREAEDEAEIVVRVTREDKNLTPHVQQVGSLLQCVGEEEPDGRLSCEDSLCIQPSPPAPLPHGEGSKTQTFNNGSALAPSLRSGEEG